MSTISKCMLKLSTIALRSFSQHILGRRGRRGKYVTVKKYFRSDLK
jgi:hypothetical protein